MEEGGGWIRLLLLLGNGWMVGDIILFFYSCWMDEWMDGCWEMVYDLMILTIFNIAFSSFVI